MATAKAEPYIPDGNKFGRIENTKAVQAFLASNRHPVFGVSAASIKGSGEGKTVLLYEAEKKVAGGYMTHNQAIGDCVSHGFGRGVDLLACIEIVAGEAEEWRGETATEILYGGSRVEIGGGRLGGSDGSSGGWMAEWLSRYGTLLRGKYGSLDLTKYSGTTAKKLGRAGVPDELEPKAKEHPVRTCSLVTGYDECRDAIANGYPVPVCSGRGFNNTRDRQGFLKPSGSWPHCMLICGVCDDPKRPGVVIANSWGPDWVSGPMGDFEIPPGSFRVDADVVDKMLREQDSYSLSGFEGYPAQSLDLLMI